MTGMKTVVSEKGQVTIPKACRDALGLVSGSILHLDISGHKLIGYKEVTLDPIQKWRGRGRLPGKMRADAYLRKTRGDYSR
jgi:antitoxin PrlF